MKRFKIGFAAVIALVATVMTLSSFRLVAVQDGCWRSISSAGQTYNEFNAPVNPNPANQVLNIADITLAPTATSLTSLDRVTDCPAPFNEFCCYQVTQNKIVEVVYGDFQQ